MIQEHLGPRSALRVVGSAGGAALTFDDVLLVPGYSETLPAEVDLRLALHPRLRLNIPIVSAAMDTVTEARLAIALAREG
ncbi:MAG: IMP dehydrogenase, partial [Anaerolineae bacterium]